MQAFILRIVAFAFAVVGFAMLIGTIGNYEMIPDELGQWIGMLCLMCLLPSTIAFFLFRKAKQVAKDKHYRKYESKVIALAKENNFTITAAIVAVKTDLTIKEAEAFLKGMYLDGLFDMEINDDARVEYRLRA